MRDDAGMIELRQRLGLAGEAFGKRGIVADAGRKNFQRDDAVELLLPRLIDRAHAAFADEFEDFELRKLRREFGDGRRIERRLFGVRDGVRRRAGFEQAGGAKSGQRAGGQRRAALRTFVAVGHGLIQFYRVHAHFRSKTGRMLPGKFKKRFEHSTFNAERRRRCARDFIGSLALNVER